MNYFNVLYVKSHPSCVEQSLAAGTDVRERLAKITSLLPGHEEFKIRVYYRPEGVRLGLFAYDPGRYFRHHELIDQTLSSDTSLIAVLDWLTMALTFSPCTPAQ